ncbi:MAG: PAS domain-containing protein, partial [Proteobacteria bacterium]
MKTAYGIFDTLLEPTFALDGNGRVIYCNETAALLCEQSVRKIMRGAIFADLLKFSEPVEVLNRLPSVTDPTPYKELGFTTPSGQIGKLQMTIQPSGVADQWLLFARDVTLEERLQKKYRGELEQKENVIADLEKARNELERYSKNLEVMVAERTQQISRMNVLMKALLDSLGQGFLIFDKDGTLSHANRLDFVDEVIDELAAAQLPDIYAKIAIASNNHDHTQVEAFAEALRKKLGV